MKLILHHFCKDVRLMRWLLGVWLLLVALQTGLIVFSTSSDYRLAATADSFNSSILLYIGGYITWMLVIIRLVQSEPVTGSSSFWRTRPVPPWVSASSKIGFILAFAVLPSVLLSVLQLSCFQVEGSAIRDHATALLGIELAGALIVVWLATYTRNLVQIWAVIALVFMLFTVSAMFTAFHSMGAPKGNIPAELMLTRSALAVCFFFGGICLSLLVQYGWRRTRPAFLIGLGGIVLSFASSWFPVPLPVPHFGGARHPSTPEARVEYRLFGPKPVTWGNVAFTGEAKTGRMLITPPVMPSGSLLLGYPAWTFKAADGKSFPLSSSSDTYREDRASAIDWIPELRRQNPDLVIFTNGSPSSVLNIGFALDAGQLSTLKNATGTLRADLNGDLVSLKKCAEIPLGSPGTRRLPGIILRMPGAEKRGTDVIIRVRELGYLDERPGSAQNFPLVFLVVDPKDRIALSTNATSYGTSRQVALGTWGRLSVEATLETNELLPPDKVAAVEARSIDDFVLQVYQIVPNGKFVSDVTVPNFTFDWP